MYEPYQILGAILFGALGLYLAVFYGSLLVAYIYGAYLHDGDKEIWSLPKWLDGNDNEMGMTVFVFGAAIPIIYLIFSLIFLGLTQKTGVLTPYILMAIASAWAILYVLRAVIRLNKKLDKHASDKSAHK